MALIFPRLARNFVKDGYFPTDSETLNRICQAIDPGSDLDMARIIDPCCGEGAALDLIELYLKDEGRNTCSYGIEINEERAWHAKNHLHEVAHANIEHVWVSQRSCGLLFLNPPYGDMISDKGDIGDDKQVRRFEAHFLEKSVNWLQQDGLMVLIVPHYIVDEKFARIVASYFTDTSIWLAPVQDFKQCVIFGRRRRQKVQPTKSELASLITADLTLAELPEHWTLPRYSIPGYIKESAEKFTFKILQMDAAQLAAELTLKPSLWAQYKSHFAIKGNSTVRPLMPMSQWHLALALVSGQINGFVEGQNGSRYLVKGSTHKTKQKKIVKAGDREDVIMLDRFLPRIVGFNLTPGPDFASVIHIVNQLNEDDGEENVEVVCETEEEGD